MHDCPGDVSWGHNRGGEGGGLADHAVGRNGGAVLVPGEVRASWPCGPCLAGLPVLGRGRCGSPERFGHCSERTRSRGRWDPVRRMGGDMHGAFTGGSVMLQGCAHDRPDLCESALLSPLRSGVLPPGITASYSLAHYARVGTDWQFGFPPEASWSLLSRMVEDLGPARFAAFWTSRGPSRSRSSRRQGCPSASGTASSCGVSFGRPRWRMRGRALLAIDDRVPGTRTRDVVLAGRTPTNPVGDGISWL